MKEPSLRSLLDRELILFFIAITCVEATQAMTTVQIPIYLRELGASVGDVGFFFTISMILPLVLRIFGGWFSDRIGRMRAMWYGSLAGSLAFIPFAAAARWEITLLGPAFLAIATALINPSYRAHIADHIPEAARGRVFSVAQLFTNIAWIIAPPIGGFLAQNYGSRWMFLAATLLYTISALLFLFMIRNHNGERSPAEETPITLLHSMRQVIPLAISGGLLTWILAADGIKDVAFRLSFDLMPVYLRDIAHIGKQSVGFMDGLHGIAWVIASPLGGYIADKYRERFGISLGLALTALSPLVFAFANGFWGFAGSWIVLGIGGALMDPALNALIARSVDPKLRGVVYALISTTLGVVSLPSPWIGSRIWETFGPRVPFILTVIIASLAVPVAWTKLNAPRDRQPAEA